MSIMEIKYDGKPTICMCCYFQSVLSKLIIDVDAECYVFLIACLVKTSSHLLKCGGKLATLI